jgi:hypothetical protein
LRGTPRPALSDLVSVSSQKIAKNYWFSLLRKMFMLAAPVLQWGGRAFDQPARAVTRPQEGI